MLDLSALLWSADLLAFPDASALPDLFDLLDIFCCDGSLLGICVVVGRFVGSLAAFAPAGFFVLIIFVGRIVGLLFGFSADGLFVLIRFVGRIVGLLFGFSAAGFAVFFILVGLFVGFDVVNATLVGKNVGCLGFSAAGRCVG